MASPSNHRVQITSSFAGEDLVPFGLIEPTSARAQALLLGSFRDSKAYLQPARDKFVLDL